MQRQDVQLRFKWKTEDIFTDDKAWEEEFSSLEEKYTRMDFSSYENGFADKSVLLEYLRTTEDFSRRIEKLYVYAHMRKDEDVRVSKYAAYASKSMTLYSQIAAKTAFAEPALTVLPEETLDGYIADPDFAAYEYSLRRVKKSKPHVLSAKEEGLLSLAADVMGGFHDTFTMLDNANLNLPKATLDGEEVQMSHALYALAMRGTDRAVRKEWFEKYYEAYTKLIDAITQTYHGNVKKDMFFAQAKKYDGCMQMALAGEDVSPVVYENLLSSVEKGLPTLHRYVRLRKKALGLEEQHMYDMSVPLVDGAEISLPFDEAFDLVKRGLAPLGEEYLTLFEKARQEGWIDVYETEGKRNGAYCTGAYDTHPYVLLNYQRTTHEVFTIAHEMGHAMHSYFSNRTQPYEKANYTIFLAEIASTVNEVLLLKYLSKTTEDENLKKYLLGYYLEMVRTTLFRQTQFAEFEQKAHALAESGVPLTKENLCDAYLALNKKYYGDGVVHDSQIAYEWARIPHFYNSFYVYKYATGIISAMSIVRRILTEGEEALAAYFRFLSSGGRTDPVTILQEAGVDLTTAKPFENAMQEFAETLQEFEKMF